jgi:hypothetical protein
MELKDQLREGYTAGSRSYVRTLGKRPLWDRLIFIAAIIVGGRGTEAWLSRHSALALGWRYLIAIAVASLLGIVASVVLDKLRPLSQS